MKRLLLTWVFGVAVTVPCLSAQPQLRTIQATIDAYQVPPGGSNAVVTIYKSTSLGTTWTPFKPTSIFPATRTSQSFQIVAPNTFRFYSTATVQPYGESDPSNIVTNTVTLSSTRRVIRTTVTHEKTRSIHFPLRVIHR